MLERYRLRGVEWNDIGGVDDLGSTGPHPKDGARGSDRHIPRGCHREWGDCRMQDPAEKLEVQEEVGGVNSGSKLLWRHGIFLGNNIRKKEYERKSDTETRYWSSKMASVAILIGLLHVK